MSCNFGIWHCILISQQNTVQLEQTSKSPIKLGTAEKKVLIVFIYYVLLGVTALAAFSLNSRVSNDFVDSLMIYFACEGTTPGNCEKAKSTVSKNSFSYLTDIVYMLLALFPLVNLVYVVHFSDLRKICTTCFHLMHFSRGEKAFTNVTYSTRGSKNSVLETEWLYNFWIHMYVRNSCKVEICAWYQW